MRSEHYFISRQHPVARCGLTDAYVYEGGIDALIDKSRRTPYLKNRVDEETEKAVCAYALEFPAHGQVKASNELRKQGVFVSASGVRSVSRQFKVRSRPDVMIGVRSV